MSESKMRAEFERAVGVPWLDGAKVCEIWQLSWQACLSSIVVELPIRFDGDHGGDAHHAEIYDGALDECAEAIRKTGISATFQQPIR